MSYDFDFPAIILVKTADKCLLLSTFRVDYNLDYIRVWRFDIIEHPARIAFGGTWENNGPIIGEEPIEHLNESKLLSGTVWTTGNYIVAPGVGNIYEYVFSNPNNTLPTLYFRVASGCDPEMNWHFQIGVPVPPGSFLYQELEPESRPVLGTEQQDNVSQINIPNIPVHIFRAFVDMVIQTREECPVSKERLTRANVAGTPCGHLFTNDSLIRAIQYNAKCPNCRGPLTTAQIQRY